MADDSSVTEQPGAAADVYEALARSSPPERLHLLLACLENDPHHRLNLGGTARLRATLAGVDLSSPTLTSLVLDRAPLPTWWDGERGMLRLRGADLRGADLRGANLESCDLRGANLEEALLGNARLNGASLEGARLTGADLAGATLCVARLAEADLSHAMLEDANLEGAVMRFANLRGAVLEGACLRRADLWGATLDGALLDAADLREAILREASLEAATLTNTQMGHVDAGKARLVGAILSDADLQGATLTGATLDGAVLQGARLQGLDLSSCGLRHVHLSGASLTGARLEREQLGAAIGEDIAHDYRAARKGYLGLEQSFLQGGDPDAASWAYRKRRRMQKCESRSNARRSFVAHEWSEAFSQAMRFAADQVAEWLCNYGESIPRVLATMTLVYVFFIVLYGLTGSVVRVGQTASSPLHTTSDLLDLSIFSLLAMTTSGSPVVGLLPHTEAVHILTGLEALCGIFLTGLLGYVVGNRIRR